MQNSSKMVIGVIALTLLVLGGVIKSQKTNSTESMRMGALLPLTGGLSSYGEPAQKMMGLAVEDVNASGGISGQKLEIVFQDHMCKPTEAVSAFKQLTATGVKIFTSVACSGTVLAIAPQLPSHDALLFSTMATTPKISGVSPFVFRNWASDRTQAKLYADEIVKRGVKKVAVLYEETDYAKGLKLSLEEFLQNTGVVVVGESFKSTDTDVRSQLVKLQSTQSDALFLSPQSVTTGHIMLGQLEEMPRYRPFLLVNENIAKSPELVTEYGALLEGALSGDYILEEGPAAATLFARYKAKYGSDCSPTNLCAAAYDAVRMLALARSTSGDNTKEVQTYLQTARYEGASGTIQFDGQHDRTGAVYKLLMIKDKHVIPTGK